MVNDMATAGGKAASTDFANRAVDFMMRKIHEAHEKITIESGAVFDAYLKNTYDALNWKRTLASGDESLCIIGENNCMLTSARTIEHPMMKNTTWIHPM